MGELIIKYKIDDISEVSSLSELEGGIYVQYNNVILTKAINDENDDGYLGNFLFSEIWKLIDGITDLLNHKKITVYIVEMFMGFSLEPENGQVKFSIIPVNLKGEFADDIINRYPCGMKGCPIPSKLLYNTIIKMGSEFINDLTINYNQLDQHGEIEAFKNTLKEAEELVDEYNKTY